MKTQPPVVEVVPEILEYKLEYTPDLRCEKQTDLVPVCHECKSCILSWKALSTREWFLRASHVSQTHFVVGIIKQFQSQDLLNYTWNLLQSTNTKDFTYSRSCVRPISAVSSSLDRALDLQKLNQSMEDLWKWFLHADFWTKANYMLLLLQMCDSQLLLTAANLIRILLCQDETFKKEESALGNEEFLTYSKAQEKSTSQDADHLTFIDFSSDHLHLQKAWSKDSDELSGDISEGTGDNDTFFSVILNVTSPMPASSQKYPNNAEFKDFIRCLPIHLSKRILYMLDQKSLNRCSLVSLHWNFLVTQIKRDVVTNRALRNRTAIFQGLCPKRAIGNYAKIVTVAIPKFDQDGDIIPVRGKSKLYSNEFRHLRKAYHGQETDSIKLEERNVFCSSYNIRLLIDSLDPNRVVHYTGGKLLAIGSSDRKIRFLNVTNLKSVPLLICGHAGSIRALYINEQQGFLLSGSYDLSIRMWNILLGTCVKIFNGHSGSITCLDVYKKRFVSGSRDCTAKMWDINTGKCIKTFGHKGIVWAAKMNETHVVSSCNQGVVKVWHAQTFILIKTLEGHRGPVKSLSFDEWHLVSGSNDGYVLGWSMLGKHNRCLMAFKHPMEVLYLGFLYLRIISGCADGKIRIFNFLTGTCLRIMRANSRGDPVLSICISENKLLINAKGSVVLFQFEEVEWDHTHPTDRIIKIKDKSKVEDVSLRSKPSLHSHSERQKQAKKNIWKLYRTERDVAMLSQKPTKCSDTPPDLQYEMMKTPPPRVRGRTLALGISSSEKQKISFFARTFQCPESTASLKVSSAAQIRKEYPVCATFGYNAEAFIKYVKQKRPLGPITKDQLLLTLSTLHHAYKTDQISANMAHNMQIKDAWGPNHLEKKRSLKIQIPQSGKQEKTIPSTKVEDLKPAGGTVGMERISTPYETKTLQLNLKNSLFAGTVKSFIPTPTITRSKSCTSLSGEKKVCAGRAKVPSPPGVGGQLIGHFITTCDSIKIPRMKIGQPNAETSSRRGKLLYTYTPNPYRMNTGFRLLTTQQMKEYEEAKLSEYQANKTKVIANREKECRSAWLRKIKGLPIDDFTKENKVAAPELGENVFI
uniref:F-box domain-containing protein n=1 Tax=Anolis carolinensis TaxID=28377 RepID=G1KU79_ANOCA|nr:PREDICTED: CMT1A duplicated region transcript 1 protein isoform X1 [Anolis carolinensis]|eukprot:XP_008102505.2 PREDICTED: CMT1A duplicated region transcript 1 protein isoform X1 [Anolis carolinensis]